MTNVIKFQAPFENLKDSGLSPLVALRRGIIIQAIIDASNISDNKLLKKDETEAKEWMFSKCEDFISICEEANVEPDFVIKIAKEVILLQQNKAVAIPETAEPKLCQNNYFEAKTRIFPQIEL